MSGRCEVGAGWLAIQTNHREQARSHLGTDGPAVRPYPGIVWRVAMGVVAIMLASGSGLRAQATAISLTFRNGARVAGESARIEGNSVVLTGSFGELRAPAEELDRASRVVVGLELPGAVEGIAKIEDVTALLAEPITPSKLIPAGENGCSRSNSPRSFSTNGR